MEEQTAWVSAYLCQFPLPLSPTTWIGPSGWLCTWFNYRRENQSWGNPNLLSWAISMSAICFQSDFIFKVLKSILAVCSGRRHYLPRLLENLHFALDGDTIFIFKGCSLFKNSWKGSREQISPSLQNVYKCGSYGELFPQNIYSLFINCFDLWRSFPTGIFLPVGNYVDPQRMGRNTFNIFYKTFN